MSGHVVAAAEAAARLKLETYESTFEVEAPGTGRLGVAFRDSSELWTVTPGGALHKLGVYPGCLLLRANGRPCGATDESALAALEAAALDALPEAAQGLVRTDGTHFYDFDDFDDFSQTEHMSFDGFL